MFLDPSGGVFGRFNLAALCGCHTLNACYVMLCLSTHHLACLLQNSLHLCRHQDPDHKLEPRYQSLQPAPAAEVHLLRLLVLVVRLDCQCCWSIGDLWLQKGVLLRPAVTDSK